MQSNYLKVLGMKLHYVEEGIGAPVLFLHGSPTSSYIWRNIVPHVADVGRCVALDLLGHGKSDKPDTNYRFFDHARYLEGFITAMELQDLTIVAHDWGAKLAFNYAMNHQDNVRGIAHIGSMFMPISSWDNIPDDFRETLELWRKEDQGWDSIVEKNVLIEEVLSAGILRKLTGEEADNYNAPFSCKKTRRVLWNWSQEIPIEGKPSDVEAAMIDINYWLSGTQLPVLMFHAEPGGLGQQPMVDWLHDNVTNLRSIDLGRGLHFVQEDYPDLIGNEIKNWIRELEESSGS